jgi:hypothetical protein
MQLWRVEAPALAATSANAHAFASLAWAEPQAFASRKGRRLRQQNNSKEKVKFVSVGLTGRSLTAKI